ncbi:MAG TPA: hypothetical protein PKZ76_06050 [Xanthomonadaceae bacterium]|nr:hypothetical protein [Xanthomonadaceae bacterium]
MSTLKSYADVQQALDSFVATAGVPIAGAPHGPFWKTLSYQQFVTGNVPNVNPAFKILVKGDPANSTIIQILKGTGEAAGIFGQMPRPSPPYNPEQANLISALSDWIAAGCPNG